MITYVRFNISIVVTTRNISFWYVMLCVVASLYLLGRTWWLRQQGFPEILTSIRLNDITPQMTLMFIVTLFMWNNNAYWLQLDSSEADVRYELELTDGWYGLTAVVDQELCQRIHRGTVAVGTKLISYGAELLNCEQGCSPLEVSHFFTKISSKVWQISCFSCSVSPMNRLWNSVQMTVLFSFSFLIILYWNNNIKQIAVTQICTLMEYTCFPVIVCFI